MTDLSKIPTEELLQMLPQKPAAPAPQQSAPAPSIGGFMAENRERNAALMKGGWGSGLHQAGYDAGGYVTDKTGSPAAGYAANVATQALPALLSSYNMGPASLGEKPARWLMQSAVKPTQADRLSGASKRAMTTMLEENIAPTASGMDKAGRMASKFDAQAESAVKASPESVSLYGVGQRLEEPARRALTQVNPQTDIDAVKDVWRNFKDSPLVQEQTALQGQFGPSRITSNLPAPLGRAQQVDDVDLPVQLAHALKKGTYASLGGKSYGEVGSTTTEAQKALARGLREEIAAAVPEAGEALKKESAMMNVRDVAMNRVLAEGNKNPLGLAALRIGDNPLSTASFLADRSAAVKGLIARLAYQLGKPSVIAPEGMAASGVANNKKDK